MKGVRRMIRSRFAEGAVVFVAALLASGVVAFGILLPLHESVVVPQLQMERDGTPRLVAIPRGYPRTLKIMDLDGNVVDELSDMEWHKRQMFDGVIVRSIGPWWDAYRSPMRYNFWGWGRSGHGAMFLMRDDGYLVVYDRRTRRPALYVSPSCVSPAPPGDDDRFREPTGFSLAEDVVLLNADGKLFVADLDARRVETVYSSRSGPVSACSLTVRSPDRRTSTGDIYVCVLDGDEVTLLDLKGNTKLAVRVPAEMSKTGVISCGIGDDGIFAVWVMGGWSADKKARAAVFDAGGKLLAKHEWTPEEPPIPVLPIAVVSVIWLVFAGLCLWHARRHALARWRIAVWTVFVLLTGPMGAAVYFGVQDFAPLVKCPSCERRRPADRESCPRCGAPSEPPARTGIEIIEQP